MTIDVVGFGAGGHAKVMLDVLLQQAGLRIVGLLDPDPRLVGQPLLGVPVLGNDERIEELSAKGVSAFFLGVGGVRDTSVRHRLYDAAIRRGLAPVVTIHPRSVVSSRATLGPGVTVLAGAIINVGARLGANVLINTGALVEHDCVIGDHVHVASGARLLGGVLVEAGAHIGGGCTIRQGMQIAAGASVGAGAVVVDDVAPGTTVVGVPARPLVASRP